MTSEESYHKWETIGFLDDLPMTEKINFSVELEKLTQFFTTEENNDYENFIYRTIFCVMHQVKNRNFKVYATDIYLKYRTYIDSLNLDLRNIQLYEESEIIHQFLDNHYKE